MMLPRLLAVTIAMLAAAPAAAQEDKVDTGSAVYEIRRDAKNEDRKCVFKGGRQILCITRDNVTFGAAIKTKDYTVIPLYDDCGGSACGRSQTTLLIERGKDTKVDRTLKSFCVECEARIETKADANEISFKLDRKDGRQFTALFRDGAVTVASTPLDPKEPLSDDDCTLLYGQYLDTCLSHKGRCQNAAKDQPGANARSLIYLDGYYAVFPKTKMIALCSSACSSKKKPERAAFDRDICRKP